MSKISKPIKDSVTINENMVLEEILQEITKNPNKDIMVQNNQGKIVGKISIKELLIGIKRPNSKTKNYT